MKIEIHRETIDRMFDLCDKHRNGNLKYAELSDLLEHQDYKIEFERYNNTGGPRGGFTKEEYIDFFMGFYELQVNDIKNERLRMRYHDMKYFFDHFDYYKKQIKLLNTITDEEIKDALKYTQNGLPETIEFKHLNLIFSIGMGNSAGWFYNNYSHYDIVHFLKSYDLGVIKNIIAHESHHIGFSLFIETLDLSHITLEEYFYLFLAGEGLAVKYCNNGQGILTKKIYDNEANVGLDKLTWEYLNSNFAETFHQFKEQIYKIREGKIREIDELNRDISDYWLNLHTSDQNKSDVPRLKHSRNYSLGNDLWGIIHDNYGKDDVYKIISNLNLFPEILNDIFYRMNRLDLLIN